MKITRAWRNEQVAKLRQTESKNDVVPLIGNMPSMRLVLAWPKVHLYVPDEIEVADLPTNTTAALWHGIELDFVSLAEMTRMPVSVVKQHVREAQLHRWIYPDASVHVHALELARATIVKVARGKEE